MTVIEIAKNILIANYYLCLATCDKEGNAWSTPITYVADDKLNIYFHSALDSLHIEHIRESPIVSFSIYDSHQNLAEIDGLQGKALVGQLEAQELERVHSIFFKRHIPDEEMRNKFAPPVTNYNGEEFPQLRFFQLKPVELYKKDLDIWNVSRRCKVDIEQLLEI